MSLGFGFGFPRRLFGATAWTPAQIPTALWLDANDTSTITLNGSNVSQWNDKSGNGRNAVQAAAVVQPTYNLTGLNGKPTLSFDGFDVMDGLWSAATSDQATIAVVGAYGSSAGIQVITSLGSSTVNSGLGIGWNTAFNAFLWGSGDTNRAGFIDAPIIQIGILSQSSITLSVNGNTSSSAIGSAATLNSAYQVGAISGTFFMSNGSRLSEVIVLNSAASTTDRQLIEGYLAWKWGTQASLPADHPYKNAPPTI